MEQVLARLRAAAEATRLRLLAICAECELTVSEITQIIGQSQPRVSRHLKLLCEAGLLVRFREGTWVFYRTPHSGPGADLVQPVLDLLPKDDETLALDRARLGQVKAEREKIATEYFRANAEDWDRIRSLHVDEASEQVPDVFLSFSGATPKRALALICHAKCWLLRAHACSAQTCPTALFGKPTCTSCLILAACLMW